MTDPEAVLAEVAAAHGMTPAHVIAKSTRRAMRAKVEIVRRLRQPSPLDGRPEFTLEEIAELLAYRDRTGAAYLARIAAVEVAP